MRANVEATMKQFRAPLRNGKLRTRGLWAASRCGFLLAIAINFGRIYRYLQHTSSPSGQPAAALSLLLSLPRRLRALFSVPLIGSNRLPLPAAART